MHLLHHNLLSRMSNQPHIVISPSSGMGHLAPFLSLASSLSSPPYTTTVTLVVVLPTLTSAESLTLSSFFSSHPQINRLDFHLPPNLPPLTSTADPFVIRYDDIYRSAHLLTPILSSLSPPISAVFSDFLFTEGLNTTIPLLPNPFPNYTICTNSARFFALFASLPRLFLQEKIPEGSTVEIPGIRPFPPSNIPPKDLPFIRLVMANAKHYPLSKGILVNTFQGFEAETLNALNSGVALPGYPPIHPIGPLKVLNEGGGDSCRDELLCWLDEQREGSVVYVSFGNRSYMSTEQIVELGAGLERSGFGFIWVVKSSKLDKEDKEGLEGILGQELYEKLCKKGKAVKRWVSQKEILGHNAVGGFVSHCGWNSVVEAANSGVPVLGWPIQGEQRENAEMAEKAGLGVWEREWSWFGEPVGADEIAKKVGRLMGDEGLRESARRVGEEARKACEEGGSSRVELMNLVDQLKKPAM